MNVLTRFLAFFLTVAVCNAQVRVPDHFNMDTIPFEKNVVTHVLFHEFGHAVFREFGMPIVANEEATADSFANYYIIRYMRDDAVNIVTSRALSWMIEDSEVAIEDYDMMGEHDLDIRRAYQALCQAYGADPADWGEYFEWVGFSESDLASCSETSPDMEAAWDQVIQPYFLKDGAVSNDVRVVYGNSELNELMQSYGVLDRLEEEMNKFDWPKPVEIYFGECPGGASWSKSERRITLCDSYLRRFMSQKTKLEALY